MLQVVLFLQTATLQNILICKFIQNELHIWFYYKVGQALLQKWGKRYYNCNKAEPLLQF